MATTTKGTQQKRRSKGDGSIFKIREEDGQPDTERKGYRIKNLAHPPKEKRRNYWMNGRSRLRYRMLSPAI